MLAYFVVYAIFIWYFPNSEVTYPLVTLFTTPTIWATIAIVCFITLGLDFALKKYSDYHKNMLFNQEVEFKEARLNQ